MTIEIDVDGVPFIPIGESKIKLEKQGLTEDFKQKAKRELRETPENVEKALVELKKLVKSEPGLRVPADEDEYLIKFLRPCKFYAESAFALMKRFYVFKKKHPEQCYGLLPSKERNMMSQSIITFQEMRDNNGSRILTIESGAKWKPSQCSLGEMFRGIQLALEAAMEEPSTQVAGVVVLLDMRGFSLSHVMQFTPSFAKMVVDWIQECIPLRLKAVHIVNQPYVFNMVFTIFKPFMKEKLRKRLHFHGENRDSLKKGIPAEAMRPVYGGSMDIPELDGSLLCDLLCRYEENFARADSYGYDRKES